MSKITLLEEMSTAGLAQSGLTDIARTLLPPKPPLLHGAAMKAFNLQDLAGTSKRYFTRKSKNVVNIHIKQSCGLHHDSPLYD